MIEGHLCRGGAPGPVEQAELCCPKPSRATLFFLGLPALRDSPRARRIICPASASLLDRKLHESRARARQVQSTQVWGQVPGPQSPQPARAESESA